MKTCLFPFILLAGLFFASGCSGNESGQVQQQLDVYKLAMEAGDFSAAKHALYNLVTLEPSNVNYKDSLTRIYFILNGWRSCIHFGEEVLKFYPDRTQIQDMVAVSYLKSGKYQEALERYKGLYQKTGDGFYAYQQVNALFDLGRFEEVASNVKLLLENADKFKEVNIEIETGSSMQLVPMLSALYNVKGVVQAELKDLDGAKVSFQKALELFPAFIVAGQNLESMLERESGGLADKDEKSGEE